MQQHKLLAISKLMRLIRPFLRTVCAMQVFLAIALLLLAIGGILVGSAFAYVAICIWAGCLGSLASASWAFVLSRSGGARATGLLTLVALGHLAIFILSFFSAKQDFHETFSQLQSFLDCESNSCSVLSNSTQVQVSSLLTS